jgi:molybdenum cofactor cytidylyltransferase
MFTLPCPGEGADVRITEHYSLTEALSLGPRELVATVGGGGKTSLVRILARESSDRGARTVVTTTTAMYLRDLETLGPVLLSSELSALSDRLDGVLAEESSVGVARESDDEGKVVGLPPEWVDILWSTVGPDYLLVEADGSRGMSLKAFGAREPQVPAAATVVVQVAGLDVLGAPLAEPYVHRADLLATALGVPPGTEVTARIFLEALRVQLRVLQERWPAPRTITLLNKAEQLQAREIGAEVAIGLLEVCTGREKRSHPDLVLVGSLREQMFLRVTACHVPALEREVEDRG